MTIPMKRTMLKVITTTKITSAYKQIHMNITKKQYFLVQVMMLLQGILYYRRSVDHLHNFDPFLLSKWPVCANF